MNEETKRFFISETVSMFIIVYFIISIILIKIIENKILLIINFVNYFLYGITLWILAWYGIYKLMENKNEHSN